MKKIIITHKTIIYVLSPAFFKTGGTELLHQYVCAANASGLNSKIVYVDATHEKGINPAFCKYVDGYLSLSDVEDKECNIVIIPEIYTEYVKVFKNARVIIWWESVDNYLVKASLKYSLLNVFKYPKRSIRQILYIIFGKNKSASIRTIRKKVQYHFVQSYYAKDFLKSNKITNGVFYVSDYINDIYLQSFDSSFYSKKNDIVCYNPLKGKKFTSKIIHKANNIKFVPLTKMTNEEVFNTLQSAKVYIDFGEHPGKDRFPREAAMLGCCIITNTKGSAYYYEDVRIGQEFKFNQKTVNINKIIAKITKCLDDYSNQSLLFKEYQAMIKNEKTQFIEDLRNCYEIK